MSQSVLHNWRNPVSPRSLALWLLSTAAPEPLPVAVLIDRGAIFGIEPAAVRVALGRLVRDGMAQQPKRGIYALGPRATTLHAKARSWMQVEKRVQPWTGAWIVVLTHSLGRTDRARLQRCERALRLTGLAPAGAGTWVRPDNLRWSTAALHNELSGLGLEEEALLLAGCTVEPAQDRRFRALWPITELEKGYRYWLNEMTASDARVRTMSTTEAARETYLLGQSVLRAINSDPLLPSELIDVDLRGRMVAAMERYNAMALVHWNSIASS